MIHRRKKSEESKEKKKDAKSDISTCVCRGSLIDAFTTFFFLSITPHQLYNYDSR
jgi:hypothetical protein